MKLDIKVIGSAFMLLAVTGCSDKHEESSSQPETHVKTDKAQNHTESGIQQIPDSSAGALSRAGTVKVGTWEDLKHFHALNIPPEQHVWYNMNVDNVNTNYDKKDLVQYVGVFISPSRNSKNLIQSMKLSIEQQCGSVDWKYPWGNNPQSGEYMAEAILKQNPCTRASFFTNLKSEGYWLTIDTR